MRKALLIQRRPDPAAIPAGSNQRASHAAHARQVLDALTEEFVRIVLPVITVTSVANALGRGQPITMQNGCSIYLPIEPSLHPAVERGLVSDGPGAHLIEPMHLFYQEAVHASLLTRALEHARQESPGKTAREWRKLSLDWQATCAAALRVCRALVETGPTDETLIERLEMLVERLIDAEDGGAPAISSDGTVIIPGIIDRRASERVRLGAPVWLEATGRRQRVTLQDVSQGGAGIAFCQNLAVGLAVNIQLACGRLLNGIVVWTLADRAGVRFLTTLLSSDPLLVPRPMPVAAGDRGRA